jgi:hypothetical protein
LFCREPGDWAGISEGVFAAELGHADEWSSGSRLICQDRAKFPNLFKTMYMVAGGVDKMKNRN